MGLIYTLKKQGTLNPYFIATININGKIKGMVDTVVQLLILSIVLMKVLKIFLILTCQIKTEVDYIWRDPHYKLKYVTRLYSALDAYERNAENHLSKQNLKTLLKEGAIRCLSQKLNDYLEHQYFRLTQPDAQRAQRDRQEEVELQPVFSADVTL